MQVGFDTQKKQRVTKPLLGHFEKAGSDPKSFIREFRLPDGTSIEGALDLSVKQFAAGDVVDVIGQSKGKGFQGVMKKHNMAGQGASHGSMMHRRNGAIGNRSTPGRIWKNMGMPGHMGDRRVTVQNLRVFQVREEDGVILVTRRGARSEWLLRRGPSRDERSTGGCEVSYGCKHSHCGCRERRRHRCRHERQIHPGRA